jgi:hypothetical protein
MQIVGPPAASTSSIYVQMNLHHVHTKQMSKFGLVVVLFGPWHKIIRLTIAY